MSNEIWMGIIGVLSLIAGYLINGFFSNKSLKATLKNNLDLALIALQQEQVRMGVIVKETQDQAIETHKLVNSRMTELLELTKKASKAEGKKEEKAEQEQGEQPTENAIDVIDVIKDEQKDVMLKQNKVMTEQKVIIKEQKQQLPTAKTKRKTKRK